MTVFLTYALKERLYRNAEGIVSRHGGDSNAIGVSREVVDMAIELLGTTKYVTTKYVSFLAEADHDALAHLARDVEAEAHTVPRR